MLKASAETEMETGRGAVGADPERILRGGKSVDWGHSIYKFVGFLFFSCKYEQILRKFKILSGGIGPHSSVLGSAPDCD